MEGAVDSGATGHFLHKSYRGVNHEEVSEEDATGVECVKNQEWCPLVSPLLATDELV